MIGVEGDPEARKMRPLRIESSVRIQRGAVDLTVPLPAVGVREDGGFSLNVPPGLVHLRVTNAPKGWGMKSVVDRGRDVTDGGVDAASSPEVRDVIVTMTGRPTQIMGTVVTRGGEPARDYVVVVFPSD